MARSIKFESNYHGVAPESVKLKVKFHPMGSVHLSHSYATIALKVDEDDGHAEEVCAYIDCKGRVGTFGEPFDHVESMRTLLALIRDQAEEALASLEDSE